MNILEPLPLRQLKGEISLERNSIHLNADAIPRVYHALVWEECLHVYGKVGEQCEDRPAASPGQRPLPRRACEGERCFLTSLWEPKNGEQALREARSSLLLDLSAWQASTSLRPAFPDALDSHSKYSLRRLVGNRSGVYSFMVEKPRQTTTTTTTTHANTHSIYESLIKLVH